MNERPMVRFAGLEFTLLSTSPGSEPGTFTLHLEDEQGCRWTTPELRVREAFPDHERPPFAFTMGAPQWDDGAEPTEPSASVVEISVQSAVPRAEFGSEVEDAIQECATAFGATVADLRKIVSAMFSGGGFVPATSGTKGDR